VQSAVALAVASWVLVIAADLGVTWSDAPTTHGPHPVASAPGAEFAAILEHPHMQDDSAQAMPDILAGAVVPRAATVLLALGLLAAVAVLASSFGRSAMAAMRDPPCTPLSVLSGRQLLTRFCIARC